LFINECYIATSLLAFGSQELIPAKRLWEQTQFIAEILRGEFMVRDQITTIDGFNSTLRLMQNRGFITI
jgi:hypothetical protein